MKKNNIRIGSLVYRPQPRNSRGSRSILDDFNSLENILKNLNMSPTQSVSDTREEIDSQHNSCYNNNSK